MVRPYRRTTYRGFSTVGNRVDKHLYDIMLIKQDILNHLHTRKNERLRDADYGSIIFDLVFDLQTEPNVDLVQQEIIRVIQTETRVIIQGIRMTESDHTIRCEVDLLYIGLEVTDTFVLDFDLRNKLINVPREDANQGNL